MSHYTRHHLSFALFVPESHNFKGYVSSAEETTGAKRSFITVVQTVSVNKSPLFRLIVLTLVA
jgi:hypothetical protein